MFKNSEKVGSKQNMVRTVEKYLQVRNFFKTMKNSEGLQKMLKFGKKKFQKMVTYGEKNDEIC